MTIATIIHQDAALARLAQFLRAKTNVTAILRALTNRAQDVETAFQQLLLERALGVAVGAQLDTLGEIVGQQRGGASDTDYRVLIRARIKINNSSGTTPEILAIYALLWLDSGIVLHDEPPAAFTLSFGSIDSMTTAKATVFVKLLRTMKAAGVRALLEYGIDVPGVIFTLDGAPAQALDNGQFRGTLV